MITGDITNYVFNLCFFSLPQTNIKQKDWADAKLPEHGLFSCLSVIPKVLLAGAITLMDEAYYKLAVWLNDKGRRQFCMTDIFGLMRPSQI